MANPYARDNAQITVIVGGRAYAGWLQSEVSRSIEAIAGVFSIPISMEAGAAPPVNRQDEVEIKIGNVSVIKGYVLAAEPFYKRNDCGLRIVGRDRTGDLVHCSAIYKGGQWLRVKLDRIVSDLVGPFGLSVSVDTGIGKPIADFKIAHGETVLDAISRAARLRGVLVTRGDAGQILLTRAGKKLFKGVIQRGVNVIDMQGIGTDEQRHSEYIAFAQGNIDIPMGLSTEEIERRWRSSNDIRESARDDDIKRYLPLIIQSDGNTTRSELKTLVQHAVKVRRGHALGIRYRVEGWTFEGEPWPVNARVEIFDDVAGLAGDEWLICSVKQTCDISEGDVTELVVRPVDAYDVAPLNSRPKRQKFGAEGPHDHAASGGKR